MRVVSCATKCPLLLIRDRHNTIQSHPDGGQRSACARTNPCVCGKNMVPIVRADYETLPPPFQPLPEHTTQQQSTVHHATNKNTFRWWTRSQTKWMMTCKRSTRPLWMASRLPSALPCRPKGRSCTAVSKWPNKNPSRLRTVQHATDSLMGCFRRGLCNHPHQSIHNRIHADTMRRASVEADALPRMVCGSSERRPASSSLPIESDSTETPKDTLVRLQWVDVK